MGQVHLRHLRHVRRVRPPRPARRSLYQRLPGPGPCRAAAGRGFTLVELTVVTVLLVLLLGMAVPSLQAAVARVRLEGVVNELGADLQHARAEAVRRREPVALTIDAQGAGYAVQAGALQLKAVALPQDIRLSPGGGVVFDGLRATAGADAALEGHSTSQPVRLRIGITSIGRLRLCTPDDSFGGYPPC